MAPLAVALFAASTGLPGGRRNFLLLAAGTALFALVLNAATISGAPRLVLGPLSLTAEGFAAGGERALRLLGLFGLARLVRHLLSAADLADAVEWAVAPIERAIPRAAGFGLALGLALRFLPEIEGEAARVRLAQRARPARPALPASRAPWSRFAARRIASLEPFFLPLLAGAVRRAEEVARTLDARGFGSGPRTPHFGGLGVRGALTATGLLAAAALLLWAG
jgi:energy-coupling factor transporter transmembrane protein EcfT